MLGPRVAVRFGGRVSEVNGAGIAGLSGVQLPDFVVDVHVEGRQIGADGVVHNAWREVRVVLRDHACVGMAERLGDDREADTGLHQGARVGMAQRMKADGRLDLRRQAVSL